MIVTENQPDGTPTWIDLGIPDLDRGLEFYAALFGWQFEVGPAEFGRYTMAYANGRLITFGPTAWSSIAAVHTCTVPQPSRM